MNRNDPRRIAVRQHLTWTLLLCMLLAVPWQGALAVPGLQRDAAERWAILFIDPQLDWHSAYSSLERVVMSPKIAAERIWYEAQGYRTKVAYADRDTVKSALLDPRVKALSYFGHGGGMGSPSLAGMNAQVWRDMVFQELLSRYSGRMHPQSAFARADRESRNLGLDTVSNHSCRSLKDDSLAQLMVRRGGMYYGVPANRYAPCDISAILSTSRDALLTGYRVGATTPPPVALPTPTPMPTPDPSLDFDRWLAQQQQQSGQRTSPNPQDSGWCVWYADDIALKPVMVGTCDAYRKPKAKGDYEGGGRSRDPMRKVLLVSGASSRKAAVRQACTEFHDFRRAGQTWVWTTWLGYRGSVNHDIDELGGCKR